MFRLFFSLQRYIIFLNNQKKKALKSAFRVFRDTQIPMVTIFFLHTLIFIWEKMITFAAPKENNMFENDNN